MNIFNIFQLMRSQNEKQVETNCGAAKLDEILDTFKNRKDYLGEAAQAGHSARKAVKAGCYDKAWGLLNEQKTLYMQHAQRCAWKAEDVLCLDGSVSKSMANILRLEKKHHQALVHILYWIITSRKSIKDHRQKLRTYFGRCKFQRVTLEDAEEFIMLNKTSPDFITIQTKVHD